MVEINKLLFLINYIHLISFSGGPTNRNDSLFALSDFMAELMYFTTNRGRTAFVSFIPVNVVGKTFSILKWAVYFIMTFMWIYYSCRRRMGILDNKLYKVKDSLLHWYKYIELTTQFFSYYSFHKLKYWVSFIRVFPIIKSPI